MTRGHLVLSLLPTAILIVLAVGLIATAWKWNQSIEARRSMFAAIEENARTIDRKAGIPSHSHMSAAAMAQALKAGDDAETAYTQVLRAAGVLTLLLAGFNGVVVWRLRRGAEPSNPTYMDSSRKERETP